MIDGDSDFLRDWDKNERSNDKVFYAFVTIILFFSTVLFIYYVIAERASIYDENKIMREMLAESADREMSYIQENQYLHDVIDSQNWQIEILKDGCFK